MTLQAQWTLTYDDPFVSRCRAACTQEAVSRMTDATQKLARDLLSGQQNAARVTFQEVLGGIPELVDTATQSDGSVNSALITDDQINAQVQAIWPQVFDLYYGSPTPPTPVIPEVTDVSPTQGPGTGTALTVTGTGLTNATKVNVNVDCTNLVVVSDTQLTCTTANPSNQKGFYPVLVTVDGNEYSGPNFQAT